MTRRWHADRADWHTDRAEELLRLVQGGGRRRIRSRRLRLEYLAHARAHALLSIAHDSASRRHGEQTGHRDG